MMHRDSTGVVQRIEPGAVNWMTAGSGIVHSERTPDDMRAVTRRSHGLQLWCALPEANEEDVPSFQHTAAAATPSLALPGGEVRVLIGSAFGLVSPVSTSSPTLYVDLALETGASLRLPDAAAERAVYGVDAGYELDGVAVPPFKMAVLEPGSEPILRVDSAARIVMIGGTPLGRRFMVWNFVSSSKERILKAEDDWEAQRFERVPGETEFIPLPPRRA